MVKNDVVYLNERRGLLPIAIAGVFCYRAYMLHASLLFL